jgi:hypothetical protein
VGDVDLANAIIAAALIQSGEFKLSAFDERGQPLATDHPRPDQTPAERFIRQAEVLGNPDFEWNETPALVALRKLTNTIRRALYEPAPNPAPTSRSTSGSPVRPTD